ncbi:hypothetical protein A1O7_03965 [Cladophialophora yegresii CBS 114405]|uniref:Signal recognition particle subunit SRP14 n=1 Tax=Cladophialophora yegresii CBS 114405 TaxID=1182544 RepID=W9VVW1_9EURO|nr:uncharacterized protein A1O7_03965 [Cladophialophora yegresii CBS 114405]EXJ59818.1 hypothetical protein A1O7_03965 [Cladophialophora yegresii CBS 114405]
MSQDRLSNDEAKTLTTVSDGGGLQFLARLSTLLTSTHAQAHGSIYLTQKPLPTDPDSSSTGAPSADSDSAQILIRATNGVGRPKKATSASKVSKSNSRAADSSTRPKIRFATVVAVSDLESFYARYADVCKKGMEGLRKRDKKKAKERAKAKKKGKTGVAA